MIRPLFAAIAAAATLVASPLSQAALAQEDNTPRIIDGIAAIVNGDIITYSQVRGISMARERLLRQQFHGEELEKQIQEARKAALNDLIDRQLIVQAFHKEKFELPEHFVEQRVDEIIREDFGGDRSTFIKTLQAQNYSITEFKKLEMENHRRGHAEQKRETGHDDFSDEGDGLLQAASG
jgi:peptidyl-prolyl cis-trans isomerase SurA